MSALSVRETSRGLIFPQQIAKKRGNKRILATLVASGLLLAISCAFAEDGSLLFLINSSCVIMVLLGIKELISRFTALLEEKDHMTSRYQNNVFNLLHDVFSFTLLNTCVILGSLLVLVITYFITNKNPAEILTSKNFIPVIGSLISIMLLSNLLILEKSPLHVSEQLHKLKGLDYGSGMAHSFFHGYLRIVLPHSGIQQDKGLKEFLQDYEGSHGVKFDVYKLFILIPYSQHCPPSLASDFSPSVEVSKELESKNVDRAGVKNRNYKNSVYKIKTKVGSKKYVSAEYATPVKTLHEVMKQNTPCSNLYNKHRVDILLNFYLTLRDLIKDDPDCCDLCEPIYYNDKDEHGNFIDVGQIILSRIKQLVRRND